MRLYTVTVTDNMNWNNLSHAAENYLRGLVTPPASLLQIESTGEKPETAMSNVNGNILENEFNLLRLPNSIMSPNLTVLPATRNYLEETMGRPMEELRKSIVEQAGEVRSGLHGILNMFNVDLIGFVFALFIFQILLCIFWIFLYQRIYAKERNLRKYVEQKMTQNPPNLRFV